MLSGLDEGRSRLSGTRESKEYIFRMIKHDVAIDSMRSKLSDDGVQVQIAVMNEPRNASMLCH